MSDATRHSAEEAAFEKWWDSESRHGRLDATAWTLIKAAFEAGAESNQGIVTRLLCATCQATPPNSIPEPCDECITGRMRARIAELEGEFHYDWLRMQSRGRCGHRWDDAANGCPFCELLKVGRPKGLIRRLAEDNRW